MTTSKKTPQSNCEMIMITPAIAQSWLDESKFENRRLSDGNVAKMVSDIRKGRWVFDGNPIRFNEKGDILDGQHRLYAIVKSKTAVQSLVVRGISDDAKMTIDTGKARSTADVLHFAGHVNCTILAAACRMKAGYESDGGDMWSWTSRNEKNRASAQELLQIAQKDEKIVAATSHLISCRFLKKFVSLSVASFAYYILSKTCGHKYIVDNFFEALESGNDLPENSPIAILRNALLIREINPAQSGNKNMAIKLALIIKTWNAWREGKVIKSITYRPGTDIYPIPVK